MKKQKDGHKKIALKVVRFELGTYELFKIVLKAIYSLTIAFLLYILYLVIAGVLKDAWWGLQSVYYFTQ